MLKSGFIYITVKYNRFTDAVPFGFRPLPQANAWATGAHDQGFAGFAKVTVVRPPENFVFGSGRRQTEPPSRALYRT